MFRLLTMVGIGAAICAIAGHITLFGPKRIEQNDKRTVRRFGFLEIAVHAITVAAFLTLAATGLWAILNDMPLRGKLWVLHVGVGPVFLFGLAVLMLAWARDCKFESCDWQWAKKMGGYLWGDKHAPAARFNAGQKAYFWAIGALGLSAMATGIALASPMFDTGGQVALLWLHRLGALAFVLAGLAHLYLSTVANPGTFTAMITGKVTPEWAKNHHPLWEFQQAHSATEAPDLTKNQESLEQK